MLRGQGPEVRGQGLSQARPLSGRCLTHRPARLVFLLQDLQFGGTQRQTLELARRLDPHRYQMEIWLLAAGDDLEPVARWHGIPVIRLGRREWVDPVALARLWRRLRSQKIDILMTLTVVPNTWGRVLGRLARVPVIVGNCRGGRAPWQQFERWLWPLADHIVCNSQALQGVLTEACGVPAHRLTTIVSGVDTDYFQPTPAPGNGPPIALCLARMVPDKDHDTLLAAFRQMAHAVPEAELWLVGEGSRLGTIKAMARQFLPPERVKFLNPRKDVRPLHRQASLLVLSSKAEALPNVILEAMAAGLPVAATRVGGVPELVVPGVTGWLVEPGDAPGLAAAMKHLMENPGVRQAMGRAARKRAVQEFSMETMTRRHEALWERLLEQRRS
jgi:glycosyltransferase involved in cell wall biosynthesis